MKDVITKFDKYLSKKGLKFEAVVIGGTALILLNITNRKTHDVDCLDPTIPNEIKKASEEFIKTEPTLKLTKNWLNNGPDSLKKNLPPNWRRNIQKIFAGKAIHLYTLSRLDLLKTKLFAFCDRNLDFDDCINLSPTSEELDKCLEWVQCQDANELWPKHVESKFKDLKKALNYE